MRLLTRRSGLLAASALAGAVVCWRVVEARRERQLAAEIDDAIEQGRAAADRLLNDAPAGDAQFDER